MLNFFSKDLTDNLKYVLIKQDIYKIKLYKVYCQTNVILLKFGGILITPKSSIVRSTKNI